MMYLIYHKRNKSIFYVYTRYYSKNKYLCIFPRL